MKKSDRFVIKSEDIKKWLPDEIVIRDPVNVEEFETMAQGFAMLMAGFFAIVAPNEARQAMKELVESEKQKID